MIYRIVLIFALSINLLSAQDRTGGTEIRRGGGGVGGSATNAIALLDGSGTNLSVYGLNLPLLTASRVAAINSAKNLTNGATSISLLDNFFAMGVSNILAASGIALGTNNGVLWITNTGVAGGGGGAFNTSQFSASSVTNIKDGAVLTNISIFGSLGVDGPVNITNNLSVTGDGLFDTITVISSENFGGAANFTNILRLATNSVITSLINPTQPTNQYEFNRGYSGSNIVMRLHEVRTNINWTNVVYVNENDGQNLETLIESFTGAKSNTQVRFGPGVFSLPASQVTVPQGVSLVGAGSSATKIRIINNPGSALLSGFIVDANHTFKGFTLDITNRTSYNGTQPFPNSGFGQVAGSTASTNVYFEDVAILGGSDCVYYYQDIPSTWTFYNCFFTSGFDTFTWQSGTETNHYITAINCRFRVDNDLSMHATNANAPMVSIHRGHIKLYNCDFYGRGIVNIYGVVLNPFGLAATPTVGSADIIGCKFDIISGGGDQYHVLNRDGHIMRIMGGEVDASRTGGYVETVQPSTLAKELYIYNGSLNFGPYSNSIISSNITWNVASSTPEGSVSAAPGAVRVMANETGSNNPVYIKARGLGNTGWIPLLSGWAASNWIAGVGSGSYTNFSPTLSNATIKPLVVGVGNAAGATNNNGQIRGLEAGSNITLSENGSNVVISSSASGGSSNYSGLAVGQLTLTNNIIVLASNLASLGTNLVANGGASSFYTNAIRTAARTNIVITNIVDGQTMRIDLWVTNGAVVDLRSAPDVAIPAEWYKAGSAITINSNGFSTIWITRIGGWTNLNIETPSFELVPGTAVTFTTNAAARTITVASTATGGSSNYSGLAVGQLTLTNNILNLASNLAVLGTNLVANGGAAGYYTNAIFSGPATNIVITNIQDGQTLRIDLFVTNGATVTLRTAPDITIPASWYKSGSADNINSNGFSTVWITRIGGWTNLTIETPIYDLIPGSGITASTNHALRQITLSSSGGGGPSTNPPPYTIPITGTNFIIDWIVLGSTNDLIITNYVNAGILNTNVTYGRKYIRIDQSSVGFNTIVPNTNYFGPNWRFSGLITGINQSTNSGYQDFIVIQANGTNVVLMGQNFGVAP